MLKNNSFCFLEDDYRQVEVFPRNGILNVAKEMPKTHIQNEVNQFEFDNIYSDLQITKTLESEQITIESFRTVLGVESSIFFSEIFKGAFRFDRKVENCEGFGYESHVILYKKNNNIVLSSWIICQKISETVNKYPSHFQSTLLEIGKKWNLVLVDWNHSIIVEISKADQINKYINLLRA